MLAKPLEEIVKDHLFSGEAHVFRQRPADFQLLRNHLASRLAITPDNITVIGSAKTGFSLSPHNFPRAFADNSDIDVLVVDERLFDAVWHCLLAWNYPRRHTLGGSDWAWLKRRREELYWGWFVPDRIRFDGLSLPHFLKPLRNISTAWFNAFRGLGLLPPFAGRDVSGRLYRSWKHATHYHVEGLRQIRDLLRDTKRKDL